MLVKGRKYKNNIQMKKTLLIIFVGLVAFSGLRVVSVQAVEGGNNSIGKVNERIRERVEMVRDEYRAQQEALKEQMEVRREEFKSNFEAKREELKSRIEMEREALKTRMEKIRDTKKGETVLRIADGFNRLNTKLLRHFTEALEKLEKVLERIRTR